MPFRINKNICSLCEQIAGRSVLIVLSIGDQLNQSFKKVVQLESFGGVQ